MSETIRLSAGGRSIKVEMRRASGKIYFKFRRFGPLRNEIKLMRGAGCGGPPDWEWSVKDCRRNRIQLELLQGRVPPEISRYDGPCREHTPNRSSLYEHQRRMLNHVLTRRCCILAAEPGTGKTLTVIEGMEAVGGDWLYVAPAKVLTAIRLEFSKWESKVTPRFVSYAKLKRVLESWDGPAPLGVVFDESSRVKSPGARCTKSSQYLADSVREEHDGYVWLLTGSPAPKAPTDWWAQAEIACPGYLVESSKAHLERRCAIMEEMTVGDKTFAKVVDWREDEVKLLARRLAGLVLVVLSSECQDLPEIIFERIELVPRPSTLRDARLLADAATTAVGALSILCQLSDGFVYDEGKVVRTESPKEAALLKILGEYEDPGRLIVYARYRASVDRITQMCLGEGWEVLRCDGRGWRVYGTTYDEVDDALLDMDLGQDRRRAKKLVFLANPMSGGMGLTLTAAPAAVYFSSDFNFESRTQSLKRGHREGMDVQRGFRVYDLCHLPTDTLVLNNLSRKDQLQKLTLEEIRSVL